MYIGTTPPAATMAGDAISFFLSCTPSRMGHAHPFGSSRQKSTILLFAIISAKLKEKIDSAKFLGK